MTGGVWRLVGTRTMQALDRYTIETLGVPGALLMESAGRAVADAVLELRISGGPVLVVCGAGNNGGDGLVTARHLALAGVPVRVALLVEPPRLRGDAAANRARLERLGVPLAVGLPRTAGADVIVDALFGTGLARPLAGTAATAVRRINAARPRARVVAVDLPSGLDADTGQPLGPAVQADVTVTLALPKLGLALEPGRSLAGRVRVARIGIADRAPHAEAEPSVELWTEAAAGRRLPPRPRDGHKGTFGHVLVVAGSPGKTGAAVLAATGAGRVGAGLVTVACPRGVHDILEVKCTEAMTAPLPDTDAHALADTALQPTLELARERDAVALGPGLGRSGPTQALVRRLAQNLRRPLVIDADGLYAFSSDPTSLKGRRGATVLTPHPGEASRLLGARAAEINRDRVGAARRLADRTGAVVLLKGAASVAAAPDGRAVVNPSGGPALASGGSGDVLTGVVATLLAQGVGALEAAALGAFVHGAAADRVSQRTGDAGVLAGDVAAELPLARRALTEAARWGAEEDDAGTSLALPFP